MLSTRFYGFKSSLSVADGLPAEQNQRDVGKKNYQKVISLGFSVCFILFEASSGASNPGYKNCAIELDFRARSGLYWILVGM
jgi:hypothetical protein